MGGCAVSHRTLRDIWSFSSQSQSKLGAGEGALKAVYGDGENPTRRAHEDSCSLPVSPAPKPDSCGHTAPPSPQAWPRSLWRNVKEKNKKDVVPDATGKSRAPEAFI